jgi:uncharacterized protein YbaP (TraB family)
MARNGRGLQVAAALLAASLAAGASEAAAEPALFVARDGDSTVYMLGTVHVLRPQDEWRSPTIDRAMAESQRLFLEVDLAEEGAGALGAMLRYGTSPNRPLSSRLSEAERADLAEAAAGVGMDPKALEGLRPWFAAVTLSMKMAETVGLTQQGVEMHLIIDAAVNGIEVEGFETGDEQMRMFADLPEEAEMQLFRETLVELKKGPAELQQLIDAWKSGDVDTLGELARESIAASGDAVYQAVLVDRNRRFAEKIAALLEGAGTDFVAVGAAHLAGPDSVQRFLEERGIATERVPPE